MKEVVIEAKEIALYCARIADSKKGESICVLDVQEISNITSYLVLCSGRIDKHVRAIADEIQQKLKDHLIHCYHRDGDSDFRWVVLDYLDVIIHVFDPQMRDFYKLESLWGDAEELNWKEFQK